jgi:hypothetical protein
MDGQGATGEAPCSGELPEEGYALIGQHHMASLAGLGPTYRDRPAVRIEVRYFEPTQFTVAATGL